MQIQRQSIFDDTAYFLGDIPWKQLLLFPRSSCSQPVPLSRFSHEFIVNTGHTCHIQQNGMSRIISFKQFQILEEMSLFWSRALRTNLHHSFPNMLVNTKHLICAFKNPSQKRIKGITEWQQAISVTRPNVFKKLSSQVCI